MNELFISERKKILNVSQSNNTALFPMKPNHEDRISLQIAKNIPFFFFFFSEEPSY